MSHRTEQEKLQRLLIRDCYAQHRWEIFQLPLLTKSTENIFMYHNLHLELCICNS